MKINEITLSDVVTYLRLEEGEYSQSEVKAMMSAAQSYIISYTNLQPTSTDKNILTLDSYEDLYIAYMVLCQDMYDNRSYLVDKTNVNKVVQTILDMHTQNLVG